jgi:hypothetical protein
MTKKLWIMLIPVLILGSGCKKNSDLLDYAPVLLSPENGAAITENPPTLIWETLYERQNYDVQVSENESFAQPSQFLVWTEYGVTTVSFTVPYELTPGKYYWRVRWTGDIGG